MNLLENTSRLVNIKNHFGLRITEGASVSVFTAQSRLKRFLVEKLTQNATTVQAIKHPIDRNVIIEKISMNAKNIEKIDAVYDFWNLVSPTEFVAAAAGSPRAFFNAAMSKEIVPTIKTNNLALQAAFAQAATN
jgi:hypothetical protein